MTPSLIDAPSRVRAAYSAGADPTFDTLLPASNAIGEDELADLIELDGRTRLEAGLRINIERYLDTVPNLTGKRVAVDAAIEFAIRSGVREGLTEIQAAERLCTKHPELREAVMLAVALNEGICSTTSLKRSLDKPEQLSLPHDLGPQLPDGRPRYELRQLLGMGAQGTVYAALDRALSEPDRPAWLAVKVLRAGSMDAGWRELFVEEGLKARRIEHANVVRAVDRGVDPVLGDYVAFEFVDGGSLSNFIEARRSSISPRSAAAMMAKICRGVHAAHLAGLLHCDLKPSNVLLTREGEPKVTDFGAAARLRKTVGQSTPDRIGNLAFMAPEQSQSQVRVLAVTVDVYALGGLLFFLLTGAVPVSDSPRRAGAGSAETATESNSPRRLNTQVDTDLDAICRRALAHDPADRYGSADAMAEDLDAWLAHKPLEWARPGARHRARLFCRRQPATVAAGVLAVVAALAGTGAAVYFAMAGRERLLQQRLAESEHAAAAQQDNTRLMRTAISSFQHVLFAQGRTVVTSEWLAPLAIMESMAGPVLFDPKALAEGVWTSRIPVAEHLVARNRETGHGNSIETLFWTDMIAYWSLRVGDLDKAQAALREGDAGWEGLLRADDPWQIVRQTMHVAVRVQLAKLAPKDQKPSRAELEQLASELDRILHAAEERPAGDSLRMFIWFHQVMLFEPGMLDDPSRLAPVRTLLTENGVPPPKQTP